MRTRAELEASGLVYTITAADTYSVDEGIDTVVGTTTTNSESYVLGYQHTIKNYTGTIRVEATHRTESTDYTRSYIRLYHNGVLINTWGPAGASTTRSVDLTIVPGDTIEWWHRTSVNTALDSIITSSANKANDRLTRLGALILESEK